MIVSSIEHGKRVFDSLKDALWLAIDTETKAKPQFKGKKDALVYGRMFVRMWSLCYRGVSYSFPTNKFDPKYPLMSEWFDLLKPLIKAKKIVLVFANAGYDILVCDGVEEVEWENIWDVLIGGWMADMTIDKSLKTHAPRYGRHLGSLRISQEAQKQGYQATSSADLKEYSEYAEEDVIVTDEMFQMQYFGFIERPRFLRYVLPDGKIDIVPNPMPNGKVTVLREGIREFDKHWIALQELPILKSVIRATKTGYPVLKNELLAIRKRLLDDERKLLKQIYRYAGKKINLRSKPQVGELLRKLKVDNPFRTPTGKDKVDSKSLFKLQTKSSHPVIGFLIQLSKVQKLLGYVALNKPDKGLLWYIADDGKIHCTQNTIGAVTGRFSSSNPNLHQIPSQADMYGMKYAFVAEGITSVVNPKLKKIKKLRLKKAA